MSKGTSQTEGIQLVGRGELAFGKFFVGTQLKNLTSPSAKAELQFIAGGRLKIQRADVSVSVAYKKWLDIAGKPDDRAAELNLTASQSFGPVTPRAQLVYSPDELGTTAYSIYAETGVGWKPWAKLTVSANVGRRRRGNGIEYTAVNIGATYALAPNINVDLRLFDTNRSSVDEPYKRRLVAALRAKL